MLEKRFTLRQIFQFILVLAVGIILIAANIDVKSKRANVAYQTYTQYDSINKRITALELELKDIIDNNKLCSIIGAYTIINQPTVKPTVENVEALVLLCDCWYPDIIMAQYQFESTKGTSYVAKHNNNLFGMRKAYTRKSVRCKSFDKMGYAIYNNWQLSVIDRIYWEEHAFDNKKPSRKEYLDYIRKVYAEDANYINKIIKIAEQYNYLLND